MMNDHFNQNSLNEFVDGNVSDGTNSNISQITYSLESINEFADGDEAFVKKVVQVFIDETHFSINKLIEKYSTHDWRALRDGAHKYKSHVLMLKIEPAIESIKKIEIFAEELRNLEEIPELIENLKLICEIVVSDLKKKFDIQ